MMLIKSLFHVFILISFLLFVGCSQEEKAKVNKEIPPLLVNIITVKKEPVPIWKRYTGITKASSRQEVRARVSGVLQAKYFKDGEIVKKGDNLFKIEQSEYLTVLHASKAQKAQNIASLKLAVADVARYQPLVDEGLAPRATLEQYKAKTAQLKAAIAGDTAQINKAKLTLSYTIIKAPISGKTSARNVDIGNLVGQGESTLLTTITKIDPLYASFAPSLDDVRLFQKYRNKEKPDVYIELEGSQENIRLNGFVDFANNEVDPLTSTITMRATMNNTDKKLFPGTFVYVNLFINDKFSFLMIPPESILSDQLGKFVYISDQSNKAKRVNIKTNYAEKYYVSVSEGLKNGDKVIVSALIKIRPGRTLKTTDVTASQGIQAILRKHNLQPKEK